MFTAGESLLCKYLINGSCRIEPRLLTWSSLETFIFPTLHHAVDVENCRLRICIALKLQLFIRSNLFLKELQPVKEFCSRTVGDYLLLQLILSQQSLLDCGFHLVFRKSTENPSNETNLWFSGKASHVWGINQLCHVSQLIDTTLSSVWG